MTEEIKNNEFIDEKEEPSRKDRFSLKGLVDGTLLTRNFVIKQLPFFFFLFLLGLTYISNRYHAEKVRKNISGLKNELKELRAEALYTSSELMKLGRQTEVVRELGEKGLDLKESVQPPKKIK